ncbi:MAG: stress response translation initiation inhibitor YciH [Nanoarchaeota archaeon]|nr:stress response translation initiation inhibitor YciH [Nanoarchaeota archaeon]MBU1974769.1 stress response translation initiation inhibitor YciH [Nanoarchaeota archaeon]
MGDVDPITGLPKELGIFEELSKDDQQILVSMVKKKFGKKYTILAGFDVKATDVRDLSKKLKSKFACGGTHKGENIELQGDHRGRIKGVLVELGFKGYNVDIS